MEAGKSGAVSWAKAGENLVLPLDMAKNSVDDMYNGCQEQMKKVVKYYLQNEKNNNPIFKAVWDRSEKIVHTQSFNKVLKKDQLVAIYSYTSDKVYRNFNNAVRTQGPQYKTTFRYHALHFLLTTAIQAERAFEKKQCLTGYRRVNEYFRQDVKNTHIRFGSFTSASQGRYASEAFGDKSCFEIFTCMGADISRYSKYPQEREVLIPPYEVFKVVEIKKRSTMQRNLPCEVVYKVKSTGYVSKLNCALFPK
ncbi:GPI-linked NAD(P)(+)--arginine ADP-ribosyltransferase 1-like [Perca flavescens]|uniref:GPI-linked NAD(P)(+)--arginine ADP-ribosyltransferase 1-like n=1 Tax=Perca flavescens TaxID=8167 RepID=UPI00106E73A4|nr:GPI-linked NAD(P)(+)--arginine ADP-ribosyltransferase 1-like [Perca flavescens]